VNSVFRTLPPSGYKCDTMWFDKTARRQTQDTALLKAQRFRELPRMLATLSTRSVRLPNLCLLASRSSGHIIVVFSSYLKSHSGNVSVQCT
jgi:hypothetical protein